MICTNCNKEFLVKEHQLGMPGTKEKEPIDCPYCEFTVTEKMTNGWWVTTKT